MMKYRFQQLVSWAHQHPRSMFALLFAGALLIRLAVAILLRNQPMRWDEPYYDLFGERLVNGYGFSLPTDVYHTGLPDQPTSFQEPIYPLIVAGIYRLFGIGNRTAVYVFQMGLGALAVVVLAAKARQVGGTLAALLVGVAAMFYPPLLFFGRLLMTDILFILTLYTILYLANQPSRPLKNAAIGLLLGIGLLTRSEMLGVFCWLLLWMGLRTLLGQRDWVGFGRTTATIAFFTIITVLPWTLRNYQVHNTFIPISTKMGYNIYFYNYPMDDLRFNERAVPFPTFTTESEVERADALSAQGWAFVRNNPDTFLTYAVQKSADFWRPWPSEGNSGLGERIVAAASFVPVAGLGIIGLLLALAKQPSNIRWHALLCLGVLAIWLLKTTLFTGGFKARIAIEPILLLYAGYTAALILKSQLNLSH